MCKFEYRVYNLYKSCLHLGIELSNFCPEVFFKAGMTGVLKPCEEVNYRLHVLATPLSNKIGDFAGFPWTEIKDICKKCQLEPQVGWGLHWGRHYCSIPYLLSPAPLYTAQRKHYCTLESQYSPFQGTRVLRSLSLVIHQKRVSWYEASLWEKFRYATIFPFPFPFPVNHKNRVTLQLTCRA